MTKTCRVCSKPELRRHRHGKKREHARKVRHGRAVARDQRRWIRSLVLDARRRLGEPT